jgi:AbiTii-like protein
MNLTLPIVRKLQADALDPNVPVVNLLRTAKTVATKLDLKDALVWIDRELNGYMEMSVADLPPYRRLHGTPEAFDPYHGWKTIHFESTEHAKIFSQAPIGIAIGALEKDLGAPRSGLAFPYSPELRARLMKALKFQPDDVHVSLQYGSAWNIVDQVRNLVLNWTLELEKAGVLGEDMTFTEEEKKDAGPVSSQYFIQNVGVFGNVSGHAAVSNEQRATQKIDLDVNLIRDFVAQTRAALPLLPEEARGEMQPLLRKVEDELDTGEPDQSKLRGWLRSARAICEGAAGNLAASGILHLLNNMI